MASFGFSVSDVVLISNFAYNVYRSSKRAGGDFRAISIDGKDVCLWNTAEALLTYLPIVKSLRSHLETLNTEFVNPKSLVHRSSTKQKRELGDLLLACKDDLYDLDDELSKYKSLKTKNPRIRDRITFSTNKQASIRANIATHSERLSRVLDGLHISALGRIESQVESQMWAFHEINSKLDALYEDNRFGRRDPSMVASTDDWIKQELVDDNITEADVELNREYIAACLERIRAHGHAAGKLQGPAESREQLDNGHVKKPDLALGPERSSVEVAIAGAVRPLQPSRPPSLDVASNQRCTPSGSHLNARPLSHRPVLQSPTSGTMIPSVEGHTDRRDSGIAFNDAVLEHAFNSDKEQDANTATQSYDDSAVDALQVSSVETMAEAVHFELDLSTITAEEYARFIMSDKHLVAGGLRQVPTLLPPVSSSRKLQFRLAARLARTINDVKTVSVVAFVPLPLTPEEISAGALKRVSVERLARDSLDPKSKYTKKAQIVEIRTERGHTSCSDSSFDNLGNETLIGPLTVVFKVVKVAISQFYAINHLRACLTRP